MIASAESQSTIVACATPKGQGGVGIVRVSGPKASAVAQHFLGRLPKPRHATYCDFCEINTGALIDKGLMLFFPGPHSFTGEDVLELQLHGGPVIIDCMIEQVLALGGVLAGPGEFSYRAFNNGKIDLVQAEAIADLIAASSRRAALSASRVLRGDFSQAIHALMDALTSLRTWVEASIDFSDEPIESLAHETLLKRANTLLTQLSAVLSKASQGALLREGVHLVISGPSNAGKSSLLNTLSQEDVAIVTDIPGTTRDVLKQSLYLPGLEGVPIHCVDTAGFRNTEHIVEKIGIKKAWDEVKKADVILLMIEALSEDHEAAFAYWLEKIKAHITCTLPPIILLLNKIDLTDTQPQITALTLSGVTYPCLSLSVKKLQGIDYLVKAIQQAIGYDMDSDEGVFIARQRHIQCLTLAEKHLKQGIDSMQASAVELLAEDLRICQDALGEIVGKVSADDVLGHIFSHFCIGK